MDHPAPDADWTGWVDRQNGHCSIRWEAVAAKADTLDPTETDDFITNILWEWLKQLGELRGCRQKRFETDHFLILSDEADQPVERLEKPFDDLAEAIARHFGFVVASGATAWGGKIAVLIFSTREDLAQHLTCHAENGRGLAAEGSQFVEDGPQCHLTLYEPTGEHALLASLANHLVFWNMAHFGELPQWIKTGLSLHLLAGLQIIPPFEQSKGEFRRHQSYWNRSRLADFVNEERFDHLDPELRNDLAVSLWTKVEAVLEPTLEQRRDLLLSASPTDGGEAAFRRIFEVALKDLFQSFLGPLREG